jgi:hypothetical protein
MNTMSESSPRNGSGNGVVDGPSRWWVVLWFAWGILVSALILVSDALPIMSGVWTISGAIIGLFGQKVLHLFSTPYARWYERFVGEEQRRQLLFALMREGRTATAEYRRLRKDQQFAMILSLPPLIGLFYGALLGPVVGALCALDSEYGISASASAALGLLLGPAVVAFGFGMILASSEVRRGSGLSWRERIARRALLAISPLLIVPCVWYCLRTVIQQQHAEMHNLRR